MKHFFFFALYTYVSYNYINSYDRDSPHSSRVITALYTRITAESYSRIKEPRTFPKHNNKLIKTQVRWIFASEKLPISALIQLNT